MSPRDTAVAIMRNPWWGIVALAFAAGGMVAAQRAHDSAQDAAIEEKADRQQIERLTQTVERLDNRLRAYICDGKPTYCQ
jgi:CHASE3 domain sensor protein